MALALELDRPTRRGLDSDEPAAAGEVARDGAAIDSIEDLQRLLAEVPVERGALLAAGAAAPIIGGMYLAYAAEQGIAPARVRGTIEYAGGLFSRKPSARLLADLIAFRETAAPGLRVFPADGLAPDGPAMMIVHRTPAELAQQKRLLSLRESRDAAAVADALERVTVAAKGGDNLIPYLIDAARARATLGELTAALRRVFGGNGQSGGTL